eukprot:CAMPEP_0175990276 /NCGR_PEP_ID=MMETSP0108-20121206/52216_1 /TAXON_ID=195067 ORGANISM="Goniomonas pacifica, Strain CCMP1869" /NCGR_SAMPLE_ID=MMETSP0108 /ASSEMBLY_ACC=CAM_ASM_000204 /LENGTH=63 /DNA_ID=CAMNT_0017321729 /DNA_START=83 /DNA_END=274 /DNA_ORIENTATION=+
MFIAQRPEEVTIAVYEAETFAPHASVFSGGTREKSASHADGKRVTDRDDAHLGALVEVWQVVW